MMILGWRCPVCGASGRVPCRECHAQLRAAGPVPKLEGVDWTAALLSYRGVGRELVARAKFRNQRAALAWLGRGMAEIVRANAPAVIDVITFAPANLSHVRARGFDHGALLARVVAQRLGLPVGAELQRGRGTPLTGRSAGERHGGPPLAPRRKARNVGAWPLLGRSVLLVDDVITTGATMATAAVQLRGMGASVVLAVAAAYTPAPSARAEIVMNLPGPAR